MPYDVTLVQVNAVLGGLASVGGGGNMNFPHADVPAGLNFDTVLYSYWLCFPTNRLGYSQIGPAFVPFFGFSPGGIDASNATLGTSGIGGTSHFFEGSFTWSNFNVRSHVLLSVNTAANVCQLYINDAPVTVAATWLPGTNHFNLGSSSGLTGWDFNVGGSLGSGVYPAIADVWCAHTASFVDLSIVSNRRKFINADLTPVYLGADGSTPFGSQPNIYLTVPSGGVPTDFLVNRGMGGTNFQVTGAGAGGGAVFLTFQEAGVCSLPPLPGPPLSTLALDDVVAIDQTSVNVGGSQVFLMWSDDRGHSYGSPVGQPIGREGQYLTTAQWQRLGYARDRVFKLEWSVPTATALQGAWVEVDSGKS